jgi:hypothetical protein
MYKIVIMVIITISRVCYHNYFQDVTNNLKRVKKSFPWGVVIISIKSIPISYIQHIQMLFTIYNKHNPRFYNKLKCYDSL